MYLVSGVFVDHMGILDAQSQWIIWVSVSLISVDHIGISYVPNFSGLYGNLVSLISVDGTRELTGM